MDEWGESWKTAKTSSPVTLKPARTAATAAEVMQGAGANVATAQKGAADLADPEEARAAPATTPAITNTTCQTVHAPSVGAVEVTPSTSHCRPGLGGANQPNRNFTLG